jgi:PPOX class probable F420-dependent enzyme
MPKSPVPAKVAEFLARPNPAVIATLRQGGQPVSVPTWYLWDGGRILVNMDESRRRLDHLRHDPRVSLTVLKADDWYAHVSMHGRVVSLEDDPDLVDIDRLSRHYAGAPYPIRDRRRFSAWIEVDRWFALGVVADGADS